jgi:ABC-type transporter MlaC component
MLRAVNKVAFAAVSLLVAGFMAPAMSQQVSQAVAPGAVAVPAGAAPAAQNASLSAPATLTQDAARAFIDELGQRTLSALRAGGLTTEQRTAELGLILIDGVDFDTIALQTLGRYGRRSDSKEFGEFSTLFSAYIIDMAVEKFGAMPIDSYTVTSATAMPNGDMMVQTNVAATTTINAAWRVRLLPDGPKIVDIIVDGYSMTTHFAGQFQDWLSKAGLEGLVSKMRNQTKNSLSLVVVRAMRQQG